MKIAILGAGNIGGTLGSKWSKAGHTVCFGVRDVNSPKTLAAVEQAQGAKVLDVSAAIHESETILFSVPWKTVPEIAQTHAAELNGKLLIDATNNFSGPVINHLKTLQNAAPETKIYRAFNSLSWEVFANPIINAQTADMFYSGPNGEMRSSIHQLIEEIGVHPIWVGENDRVHLVDNMGALWVNMVFQRGWKRHSAFKAITE
jgi:8-hydroxy-5-deazaflavin:NADPH oxidoreductase